MSLSNFEWIVVHADGSTEVVVADCIQEVVMEHNADMQPVAIIRGELR